MAKLYLEKKPNQIHFKFFKEAISDLITGIPLWFQESDLTCKNLEGFLSQLASSELLFAGINFNLKEKPHELADLLSQVHNNTTELLNNYNHGVRPLIKQFQEDLSNFKEAVSKFNGGIELHKALNEKKDPKNQAKPMPNVSNFVYHLNDSSS